MQSTSLSSLSTPNKKNLNASILKAFSIAKYKPKPTTPATPGSLKKKNCWVTLDDGSLIALPDEAITSKIISSVETNEDGEEVRFYSNDASLREIDADYGTYIIEYTGSKEIYNQTTSDCSRTPTTTIVLSNDSDNSNHGSKDNSANNLAKGFFKIGPVEISNLDLNNKSSEPNSKNTYIVITYVSDDKRIDKFRKHVSLGDIVVEVNGSSIIGQSFNEVAKNVEQLKQSKLSRRFKILKPQKCSIDVYIRNMEMRDRVQRDFFGFNCSFEYLLDEKALMNMHSNVTNQRDLEWVVYLKSIGGPENLKPVGIFKPSKDLKVMVRRGIPVAYRALVWQKLSLSSMNRLEYPSDYYQMLLSKVDSLNPKVRDDIEKDVDRTFPEHSYFGPAGQGESGLRRVLQAFAVHNTEVGYCQSLNFVAGMMLIFMEEEDAFWLLVTVVEKLLPSDYYTNSMVGTYVDQFVLAHIIKKHLPNIHRTLEKNQLQLPLITVQWFMCLFVNTLRPEVTLRIWDIFFNEGSKVLFRIAAALFKLHEKQLVAVKDAADLFYALRSIGKDVVDADKLISAAYKPSAIRKKPILGMVRLGSFASHSSHHIKPKDSSNSLLAKATSRQVHQPGHAGNASSAGNRPLISPRLITTHENLGAVPDNLIGIGLAHEGPVTASRGKLRPLSSELAAAKTEMTANSSSSTPTIEEPQTTTDAVGDPSSRDMEDRASSSRRSSLARRSNSIRLSDTQNAADPSGGVRSSESLCAKDLRLSAEYLSAQKIKRRRIVTHRNGEFNFYRADIAVWRKSFRPALEERYLKMELARKVWREQMKSKQGESVEDAESDTKDNSIAGDGDEVVDLAVSQSLNSSDPITHKTNNNPTNVTNTQLSDDNVCSVQNNNSNNNSSNSNGSNGGLQRKSRSVLSSLFGSSARTQQDSSRLSPRNLDIISSAFDTDISDVTAEIRTTYNLDHEFEKCEEKNS